MEEKREYAAREILTPNKSGAMDEAKRELSNDTLFTPQVMRLALETPSKDESEVHPTEAPVAPSLPLLPSLTSIEDAVPSTTHSIRKRRAIFTDDAEDGEDDAQVFSVDTTAIAVESGMQPEHEGIVPRVSRGARDQQIPQRARRVLNLLDRLEPDAANIRDANAVPGETIAEEEAVVIRRTRKRRLTDMTSNEETPPSLGSISLFPPSQDNRPAFARSHSSQSVFLAPPKISFARSTSSPGNEDTTKTGLPVGKAHSLILPTVRSKSHPDLNVISPQTVADLLNGVYGDRLDSFELIDCRFGYEYAGGCLKGAVSLNDPAQVEEQFLRKPPLNSHRTALIFYCEFSANRAPKMVRHVRNLDRWIHAERYPELFYPELYLIDGGYKNCFEKFKDDICSPAQYQTMSDKAFVDQCKRDFATHRANWKLHKSNACASKFQQLHRHIHVFRDDSNCDDRTDARDDDLLAHPQNLRSFSQQV